MGIWYSGGADEKLFNTFGTASPTNLQTFDGGSILFVGGGRYGSSGQFPGTVDGGPVNRYAGGTFAFDVGSSRPVLAVTRTGNQLKLTWDGSGALESALLISGPWQAVAGAASGMQIPIGAEKARYYRIRQ